MPKTAPRVSLYSPLDMAATIRLASRPNKQNMSGRDAQLVPCAGHAGPFPLRIYNGGRILTCRQPGGERTEHGLALTVVLRIWKGGDVPAKPFGPKDPAWRRGATGQNFTDGSGHAAARLYRDAAGR